MENNPTAFIYWLQGFFELSGATTLNEEQVKVIKEHIALVLHKVTPSKLTIPAFKTGVIKIKAFESEQAHLCTECVVICPNSRNEEDHIGRTCPLCKVYCKNLEAKDLPIINVPTHLSC